jgi:subtilase family serine protease
MPRRAVVLATGLASALTLNVALIGGAAAAPALTASAELTALTSGTTLPSVIPAWAAMARTVAATPAGQSVGVLLTLAAQDPAGLAAYYTASVTPGSALYRHWLTQSQFATRFGPASSTVTTVTGALEALHVTSISVDKLGLTVLATMPASLATTIFGVSFRQVMHNGRQIRVATDQPTLPAALLGKVVSVSGLTEELEEDDMAFDGPTPADTITGVGLSDAPPAFFNAMPASSYYGQQQATGQPTYPILSGDSSTTKPYDPIGYDPAQLRGAYGVSSMSETGAGVKIGIVDAFDGGLVSQDLDTYSSEFGLPAPTYTDLDPALQGETDTMGNELLDPLGWEGEQTLDVEAVHLMAPGASIIYSGATAPLDPNFEQAIVAAAADGAEQVSNSYGGSGDTDQADETALDTIAMELSTMGTGLDFSTGDDADNVAANSEREVDFPAASPYVTGVGATGLEVGASNNYEGEFYWGEETEKKDAAGTAWDPTTLAADGGGGGGVSSLNAEPSYQDGVVPASETENADTAADAGVTTGPSATAPGRVLPDIAMDGDPATGMLVGETQVPDGGPNSGNNTYSLYRIGGTSVSSPLFTGILALADQAAGTSVGFVNPTMYPLLSKHDGAFRDPQVGRAPTGERLGGTQAAPNETPVVAEVRSDYADSSNPTTAVSQSLRLEGVLSTLDDLPGYDDSTGLGSPYAPQFVADLTGTGTPTPALPETSTPVLLVILGVAAAAVTSVVRRRRRRTAAA